MTATKRIHSKKGVAPKPDIKKAARLAKDAVEAKAAPVVEAPKPNFAQKAWTAVKKADYNKVGTTVKKGTNKTIGFTWSASWRTAVMGVVVPFTSSMLNTVAESAHAVISKGGQYKGTVKDAGAETLNAIYPVIHTVADHPIISTLVAAAAWVGYKFTKPAK